ncbi:DUF429 domain-containing protein [Microbulbifer hydrolyticus]|uniref:DUF429 domain-containing protein n=1 Tax=Microbulbifer hydrolyticus TaxID=48074 RepID=A0A6P1T9B8_9GAMM|nr:DUF429 domain-containing protein [Microbulbifer hydrolyticus]MBB5210954.1 hypothetical protein [Microbulbifer hydrolyticus]QHQ38233.1 DUF429 domain-containing protein [Microbulbifer hydrolyticus]
MSVEPLFIGWDVGGWNCDSNANSRDALVVLDRERNLLGRPWRGNLRVAINDASSTQEWIQTLLRYCEIDIQGDCPPVVMAIDTPLGFSQPFLNLISGRGAAGDIGKSASNPYLFRYTEHFLFHRGLKPLSPVKDMIGSQATKGMHVLARFAPEVATTGVWRKGAALTAFEAYPSACKPSKSVRELLQKYRTEPADTQLEAWNTAGFGFGIDHEDKRDALLCALVAWLFHCQPDALCLPDAEVPEGEGWIFVPGDALIEPRQ